MAKKKTKRPQLIAEQGYWFRFESYELHREKGTAYIRPKAGATVKIYKPMEDPEGTLKAYLELGASVDLGSPEDHGPSYKDWREWYKGRDRRNYERILAFAQQYGLPGILWQCGAQQDWSSQYDSGKVVRQQPLIFVPSNQWAGDLGTAHTGYTGYMEARKLLSVFLVERFPFDAAKSYAPAFLKAYGEPVNAICTDAREFLRVQKEWERFKKEKHRASDPYVDQEGRKRAVPWSATLTDLNVSRVQLRLHFDDLIQLDYGFRSLTAALQIMRILNAVSGSIRICALPECHRAFIARNERSRFCSEGHSNVHRQRAFEERKKNRRPSSKIGRKQPNRI